MGRNLSQKFNNKSSALISVDPKSKFGRISGSKDGLKVTKQKIKNSTKNFKCNFCDYTTNRKNHLTQHIVVHTREKPYKCLHRNCGASFTAKGTIKIHQVVQNKDDKSFYEFKCAVCPYKSAQKSNFDRHLKTHSDVKEFGCDLCPYRAKEKTSITRHFTFVHSNEKLFKCPYPGCQHSCKEKSNLKKHLMRHSNVQPFVCSFANCNFKSKWKQSLADHEMAHRREKPFKCSFCSFTCIQKNSLSEHTRVHTGETPYPCQNCAYRAKSSSKLTRHVKVVHGDEKTKKLKGSFAVNKSQRGTKLKCKIVGCDYSTKVESILAIHLDAAHNLPRVVLYKP